MSSWYGVGDYGVGDYATATIIPFAARGSWRMAGWYRDEGRPTFHAHRLGSTFGGASRPVYARLAAVGWRATQAGLGAWTAEARPQGRARGAGAAGGRVWWVLDPGPDETLYLPAAGSSFGGRASGRLLSRQGGWRAAARVPDRSRAKPNVHVPGFPWRASWSGAGEAGGILVQTVQLEPAGSSFSSPSPYAHLLYTHRSPRAAGDFAGDARAVVWPVLHPSRAGGAWSGRFRPRARFVSAFRGVSAGDGAFSLSYQWSHLTAPGREPAAPWAGPAIPGAPWASPSAPSDAWLTVPSTATPWNPEPGAPGAWRDPE